MMRFYLIILFFSLAISSYSGFDSKKAYDSILEQCSFGPRYPGSEGHEKYKDYLFNELSKYSKDVLIDEHLIKDPLTADSVKIYNIFARINPKLNKRVLFMAHWDTRRFADKDPNPLNHDKPVLGANDGASGVAVLLGIIDQLEKKKLNNLGVDFLFTDAEDMGTYGSTDTWAIGSRLFSQSYPQNLPLFGICVDMVADKDLKIKMERNSYQMAPELMNHVWNIASMMGYGEFFVWDMGPSIIDDHISFSMETKIPSINIIDMDYKYWHTINDIPDNTSQYSLHVVGSVLSEFIYNMDTYE
ncbi:MAG: hypothetical protein CMG00_06490 [Candidatus Marinimicrobia bacterium]|nr:hypothetical protein [Candidatus Neomarinimicrobiota bacterium]